MLNNYYNLDNCSINESVFRIKNIDSLYDLKDRINNIKNISNIKRITMISKINKLYERIILSDSDFVYLQDNIKNGNDEVVDRIINIYKKNVNQLIALRDWVVVNKNNIDNKVFKRIKKGINSSLNSEIIFEIFLEFREDVISISRLKYLVSQLDGNVTSSIDIDILETIDSIIKDLDNDQEIRLKVDDISKYSDFKNDLYNKLKNLLNNVDNGDKLLFDIEKENKIYTNYWSSQILNGLDISFDDYPIVNNNHIIAINDFCSAAIGIAFSIDNYGDIYVVDVYLSDVPTILNKNRKLAAEAYRRAISYSLLDDSMSGNYQIDMLPPILANKFLSLHYNRPKNVVSFNFCIDKYGNILSRSIGKTRIMVTEMLTYTKMEQMKNGTINNIVLNDKVNLLKELCELMNRNTNELKNIINLPAYLVNSYVTDESLFGINCYNNIYNDEGKGMIFVNNPLKKFVSDINLGLFMSQNDLLDLSDKDISSIENNMKDIIYHFNRKERESKFLKDNPHILLEKIRKYKEF